MVHKYKKEEDWDKIIDYPCGCIIRQNENPNNIWYVETFCEEHDPTIERC